VAYGRLIKPDVLERLPMLNVHFSLLPRWRGAAPVERAILAGDDRTGVDLMVVEEGLDTGGVYARHEVDIDPGETLSGLRRRLVDAGVRLLLDTLDEGIGEPVPQTGEPTYADKVAPGELQIDWSRPAEEIDRLVRLERAWTTFRGERLKVLSGHVEGDRFVPDRVQPAGKGPMDHAAWARGARIGPDERLGE